MSAKAAILSMLLATVSNAAAGESISAAPGTYTFELIGGYFYGPGPIVPDTQLPDGRLRNIHFDVRTFRGHCEFANDGSRAGLLSDGRTRINQNIDAGRLLIGGGTSPVLLTAVDGGPHRGTEQYYLDDEYRFVWRVDIALDPGFAEGIIRLEDFVLNTGVARVGRSLQTLKGYPGGYDQAGSLESGDYIAGRVGDFDQDGFLDGVLVAAPNVPMAADMLPGAPVANKRGFRTNVPIDARLSAELMLRGALQLKEPTITLVAERGSAASLQLIRDLEERVRISHQRADHAVSQRHWSQSASSDPGATVIALARLQRNVAGLADSAASTPTIDLRVRLHEIFARLEQVVGEVAALNERSDTRLMVTRTSADTAATTELDPKNY